MPQLYRKLASYTRVGLCRRSCGIMTGLQQEQILNIVARAMPLWERRSDAVSSGMAPDLQQARERLARWQNILDGPEALETRLLGSDVSRAALEQLLGGVCNGLGHPLPSWATTLDSLFDFFSSSGPSNAEDFEDRSYDPAWPLPFQEVLIRFVRYARLQLEASAGDAIHVLSSRAIAALERRLLAHMTFVASLTFGHEFYAFRFDRAPASAFESAWQCQKTSRQIYSEYVRHMHTGGLAELFDRYPVLARLLSQSLEQWTSSSVNFCRRFLCDFSALRTFFGWQVEYPKHAVEDLRTDLSDRHRGGQTVMQCMLRTGERVIYKPRTVQPEIAFYQLIGSLNDFGLSQHLQQI